MMLAVGHRGKIRRVSRPFGNGVEAERRELVSAAALGFGLYDPVFKHGCNPGPTGSCGLTAGLLPRRLRGRDREVRIQADGQLGQPAAGRGCQCCRVVRPAIAGSSRGASWPRSSADPDREDWELASFWAADPELRGKGYGRHPVNVGVLSGTGGRFVAAKLTVSCSGIGGFNSHCP